MNFVLVVFVSGHLLRVSLGEISVVPSEIFIYTNVKYEELSLSYLHNCYVPCFSSCYLLHIGSWL